MIAWLAGTWLGKAVAGAVMLILALMGVWGLGRRNGITREKIKAKDAQLKTADDAKKVRDELDQINDDMLPDRLRKWMRDEDM